MLDHKTIKWEETNVGRGWGVEVKVDGYKATVTQDEYAESPRDGMDNVGKIAVWENSYRADDGEDHATVEGAMGYHAEKAAAQVMNEEATAQGLTGEDREEFLEEELSEDQAFSILGNVWNDADAVLTIPIQFQDRDTGITWQAEPGQADWAYGMYFATYETLRKEGWLPADGSLSEEARARCLGLMVGELDTYKQFLNGEVYAYTIEKTCGACKQLEVVESCSGFYGFDYAKEDAIGILSHLLSSNADGPTCTGP